MKSLVNNSNKSVVLALAFMAALFIFIPKSFSQEDECYIKLEKAQELFDSGLIEVIPSMLEPCLKDGFNKENTIQAYRLLIQVYLFDYNQEKAGKTMLDLLSQFPEYEINVNDPVEIVNLFKQFQTKPRYSFSLVSGINLSNVSVIEPFSTGNLNNLNSDYKPGSIKPLLRVSFEKYLGTRTWITLGLGYSYAGYEINESMNFGRELLWFSENMQFADVPHYINFSFGKSAKLVPYLFAGGQFSYLIKSGGELSRINLADGSASSIGVAKDITQSRLKENYSALAGMGVRLKIATGYLRANLYYTKGITDYIKDSSRYSDNENLYYFNFIDDRIKLDYFNFTIGYAYIFYQTSKKTVADNL